MVGREGITLTNSLLGMVGGGNNVNNSLLGRVGGGRIPCIYHPVYPPWYSRTPPTPVYTLLPSLPVYRPLPLRLATHRRTSEDDTFFPSPQRGEPPSLQKRPPFTLRITALPERNRPNVSKKPATESRSAQGGPECPNPSSTALRPPLRSWHALSHPRRISEPSWFIRGFD